MRVSFPISRRYQNTPAHGTINHAITRVSYRVSRRYHHHRRRRRRRRRCRRHRHRHLGLPRRSL